MARTSIHTLDLNFQGRQQAIASYMLEHSDGVALVETGPGSTLEALRAALKTHGYGFQHVTHVFLTHIHLDHAGASGYLASQGAQIHVHPQGAAHLLNPEKLIASATRIYGELMEPLWGQFLPVPAEKLTILQDEEEVAVGGLRIRALNTPGHAEHHYAYLLEDACFTGDVGAVRIPGFQYLRLPMPPPELNLEKWRETVARLQKLSLKRIAPTHFGVFDDADWHLGSILARLDEVENWLNQNLPANLPIDELKRNFLAWMERQAHAQGLTPETIEAYRLANPLEISVDGLSRYWKKFRIQR
jgi:glyoxylase-like metal-dependent hydrolase (beta-lactamase superfamily II)